jgi:hypothetical protein
MAKQAELRGFDYGDLPNGIPGYMNLSHKLEMLAEDRHRSRSS